MTRERWKQIEDLYQSALRLPPHERAGLLSGAGPEIRAEVESLLAQDAKKTILADAVSAGGPQPAAASSPGPGTQLHQYRLEAEIGAGGMGVVFRAFDTNLHRPVAIKFLSGEIADAAARRRFQREAQTASSLNHPHIVTVYDAGEFDGRQYLVTEFIDGGTLKDWLARQPRSPEEIAGLMTGAAGGLAAAHQAGILHRDIKPQNILVTASGYAKLADFGLAKDFGFTNLEADRLDSSTRTLTEAQTQVGTIVGTVAYMSPEQASGQTLDARSDMFSFAIVLYEMLSGRRPFQAPGNLDLLQQIIHAKPAPLSDRIPEPLRGAVMRGLEKDPAARFPSMREFAAALRSVQDPSGSLSTARSRRGGPFAIAAAAAMLIAVAAAAFLLASKHSPSTAKLEYSPLTSFADSAVAPAISPDGRMLAFIRGNNTFTGRGDVYAELIPGGDPVQLTHDGGVKMGPVVFSPDGTRIAYTSGSGAWETWSVPALGGEPTRMLADAEGLSWTSASPPQIMYSAVTGKGIHMGIFAAAESRAGQRVVYMPGDVNGMAHRSFLSPRGDSVIVVEMGVSGWLPCRLVPFDGSSPGRRVGPQPAQCTDASWSPDGKVMYFSANAGSGFHIWRERYPGGAPEQITFGATEEQGLSLGPDGKSFVTSVGDSQSTLWIHDAAGEHQITFDGYAYLPSFAPGAHRLYYLQRSNPTGRFVSGELWTADLATGKKQRLVPGVLMEHYNVSPDGKQVIFIAAEKESESPLWIAPVDASAPPRRLVNQFCDSAMFAADGEIYFIGGTPGTMYLQKIAPDGSGLQRAIPEPALFLYDISPDGKWLAAWVGVDIRVYPLDGTAAQTVCTNCASAGAEKRGLTPPLISWSRNGKELYLYSESAGDTYAVPLKAGQPLPEIPALGIAWRSGAPALPGIRTISHQPTFMSGDPAVYAYIQVTTHRNIYRISVPQ